MSDPFRCPSCGQRLGEATDRCPSCATPVETLTGPTIIGYRILGLLGQGGMGTVFLAEDEILERRVAIKILSSHRGMDDSAQTRFLREARALARLDHPHVVRVHAYGDEAESPYLVMELVEGESLADRIRRTDGLGPEEVVRILHESAAGLDAALRSGLIHRDVKPANILLEEDGRVKLTDFGLAKALEDEDLSMTGLIVGTPRYMSPEQARGDKVDHRSDIFSLGKVGFEMLNGPRDGGVGSERQSLEAKSRPSGLEMGLRAILLKMTASELEDRYPTYLDLIEDLGEVAVVRRPRWRPVAVAILLFGLAGFGTHTLLRSHRDPAQSVRTTGSDVRAVNHRQVTFTGSALSPALSPDGERIAFRDGTSLMVQSILGVEALRLADLEPGDVSLRWTSEGHEIAAMVAGNKIEMVSFPEGIKRELYLRPAEFDSLVPTGFAICEGTGEIVVSNHGSHEIFTFLPALGPQGSLVVEGDLEYVVEVACSPASNDLAVVTLDQGPPEKWELRLLGRDGHQRVLHNSETRLWSPRWLAEPHELFFLQLEPPGMALYRLTAEDWTRPPDLIFKALEAIAGEEGHDLGAGFDIDSRGSRMAFVRGLTRSNLWRIPIEGGSPAEPLTRGTRQLTCPAVSPDGKTIIAVDASGEESRLVLLSTAEGPPTELTTPPNPRCAAWAPGGRSLAFVADHRASPKVWVLNLERRDVEVFEETVPAPFAYITWGGKRLLYQTVGHTNFRWLDPVTGREEPLLVSTSGWIFHPVVSPLGEIAVFWNRATGEERSPGLWLIRPDASEKLIRNGIVVPIAWLAEDVILALCGASIQGPFAVCRIDVSTGSIVDEIHPDLPGSMPGLGPGLSFVEASGELILDLSEEISDIWIAELERGATQATRSNEESSVDEGKQQAIVDKQ